MKGHKIYKKRWPIAIILMLCIVLFSRMFLKFDLVITWIVTLISASVFISLGERIVIHQEGEEIPEIHLLWGTVTVTTLTIAMYFIERGNYVSDKRYSQWIVEIFNQNQMYTDFEVGTLMLVYYTIFLALYGKVTWQMAKKNINEWIPSFWYLVGGIGLVMYIKEGANYESKTIILLGLGGMLVAYLVFRYIANREHKITYCISATHYLINFLVCIVIIVGIGVTMPECQELPGARWMRQVMSTFTDHVTLQNKIPLKTQLNNEFALSDAILFEVITSENLYLRDIAYSHYEDGVWSIPVQDEALESYIALKPQYLKAEYSQTKSLLDEIIYQNGQDHSILPSYAEIANYESSISHKKQYTVVQNPINKINYFTVNGVTEIKDNHSSNTYYYQNINNCYFHGEKLVEPSQYTVEYYDHTPRIGTREYIFLRNMNAITWESIYKKIAENRIVYGYYFDELPKLLLTYTPLVQYNNARKNFLQVPEELKEPLRALTKTVTLSNHSDWANADAICNYLKHNYLYRLHSKNVGEGDRIYKFLFEDKEGICQEFASSMVLMCRSIGIPAKYVTGYLVSEKDSETGRYIVREKDAHAFVEVYVAGYGWMTFDPTPEIVIDETKDMDEARWSTTDCLKVVGIIAVFIILFLLSRGGFYYLQEIGWQVGFRMVRPSRQIDKLVRRASWWLTYSGYDRKQNETLSEYAQRLKSEDIDIIRLIKLYEAYKYGNRPINKEQIASVYKDYKMLKRKLKNK